MNLYKISQNSNIDYDTYDSAIVCAPDEATAKSIHPNRRDEVPEHKTVPELFDTWCDTQNQVTIELIGTADPSIPQGVVLASFNAG